MVVQRRVQLIAFFHARDMSLSPDPSIETGCGKGDDCARAWAQTIYGYEHAHAMLVLSTAWATTYASAMERGARTARVGIAASIPMVLHVLRPGSFVSRRLTEAIQPRRVALRVDAQ